MKRENAPMSKQAKHTVVDEGTAFEGSVNSDCPITLGGTLNGQIEAPALHVTASGSIKGRIRVGELRSEGEVSGEIEASSVELSGRICDQTVIRAKSLEVRLSEGDDGVAASFGNCELEIGDLPASKSKRLVETRSEPVDVEENVDRDIDIAQHAADLLT
jgi:cytoskeletal protein CcmA (bactofilin family)